MIRCFDGERPAFVLDAGHTTYAFRILPTGQAEHLYYGKKIELADAAELAPLEEQHVYAPGNTVIYDNEHPEYSLEDMCLELSSLGKGDLREPFIELWHKDGGRTSDFVYDSHSISKDKPEGELPGAYSGGGEAEHLTVVFKDKNYGVTLELHYYVFDECIVRSARLINTSGDDIRVLRFMSQQLDIPQSGLAVTSFHGAWTAEMQKSTVTLPAGKLVIESRAGCSSSRANPFFMVHDPNASESSGDCWGFNLIYSGDHYAAVEVSFYGKTRIAQGINPTGFEFLLKSGESLSSPEAVISYSSEGFTGLSRNLHFFVREHVVRGRWKYKPRPVLLNSWEACYFKISEGGLLSLAKAGKELGAELFVVDDGWFGARNDDKHSLGDWTPDSKKLPHGVAGLAKKLNAMGIKMGLWFEPEMVNTDSELFRAHPDWVMHINGKAHSEGRNQRLLDLVNPAVQDFIIKSVGDILSSADISYVKWDFNRVFSDVYSPYLPPERQGETVYRYQLGLYRVMRELTQRFPEVLFEGCASGGNRFDLGILSFFPQIWASDNTDAVSRAAIQEGYSYGYPLSVIGAHISCCPNHQTMRDAPLETRFNVAAFGLMGLELDLRDVTKAEKQKLKNQIELYKKWRDVLQFGSFYRIRSGNTHEWVSVSSDGRRAVAMLMREKALPNTPNEILRPAGLEPALRYRLSSIESKVEVKRFGSLVNTIAPFHVKQGSLVHRLINRFIKMPGDSEELISSGSALMAGVKLKQAYIGTGYGDNTRLYTDFASRMYFIEAREN